MSNEEEYENLGVEEEAQNQTSESNHVSGLELRNLVGQRVSRLGTSRHIFEGSPSNVSAPIHV